MTRMDHSTSNSSLILEQPAAITFPRFATVWHTDGTIRTSKRSSTHCGTARHPRLILPRSESSLSSEEPVVARKAACAFPRICPAPYRPLPLPRLVERGDGCRKEYSAGKQSSIGRQYPSGSAGDGLCSRAGRAAEAATRTIRRSRSLATTASTTLSRCRQTGFQSTRQSRREEGAATGNKTEIRQMVQEMDFFLKNGPFCFP